MTAVISPTRFLHGRETAPCQPWEPTVPIAPECRASVAVSEAQKCLSRRESELFFSFRPVMSYRLPAQFKFTLLAQEWKQDNLFESSPWRMARHPAYLRIIGMGQRAVPLILKQLSHEVDFWFEALAAITEAEPVLLEHAGNLEAMRQDWLRWGRRHGYDC